MSKQDEFIKQLYYGDDLFYENTRKDSSKKCELNKIRDEIHKKIMKALIQVYDDGLEILECAGLSMEKEKNTITLQTLGEGAAGLKLSLRSGGKDANEQK